MNANNFTDTLAYQDWYVMHSDSSKTKMLIDCVKKSLGNNFPIVSFTKELAHKKNDAFIVVEKPLFPGYLFVRKSMSQVEHLLRKNFYDLPMKAIKFNGVPAKVRENEMRRLFQLADQDGKISISTAYKEGDKVVVTAGPLKNVGAEIKFINEKKRKVSIAVPFLNEWVQVSLSYELVEKAELFTNN